MDRRGEAARDWSAIEAEAARLYLEAQQSGDWDAAYAWVEQDPAHGYAFAKAETSWELSGQLDNAYLPEVPEDVAGPAGRFEALFSRRAFVGIVCAALIGTAGAVSIQKWMEVRRYSTPVGGEREIDLADGSVLKLNTDSSVEVALRKDVRLVRLLQGEARFNVAHESKRPFVVDAGDISFRALGTVFDVRRHDGVTALTVMSGRVGVDNKGKRKAVVDAGDYAVVSGGQVGVSTLTGSEMARRTAWSEGIITFDGETLEQAVAELNRYRAKPLVIGSPQIASLRVGGTVHTRDSDTFIRSLGATFGIRAVPGKDSVMILPGKASPGAQAAPESPGGSGN
ncbi:FecR family protein [Novosphingobium beihaiensis]|uniref:FecR domain-containing protein n=1 Tax=Novosphingobium beihaiensis TaxID=2930389 RepID=A0ABT0BLP0_9SPHN|nr:FecR domain-containing protein [Novosphingobium beihaiensis]MCJ2185746.1 FecR domain-containing protein [Novosphingobium beihaiensis]